MLSTWLLGAALGVAAPATEAPAAPTSPAGASAEENSAAAPPAGRPDASLEAYGSSPSLDHVTVSPQGERLAFVASTAGPPRLVVQSLEDRRVLQSLGLEGVKVRAIRWADEDHVLVVSSESARIPELQDERREWYVITICTVSAGTCRGINYRASGRSSANVVFDRPQVRHVHGRTLLFVVGMELPRSLPVLFAVPVASGQARVVAEGNHETRGWIVGPDGSVVAEQRYRERTRRWSLHVPGPSGTVREVSARTADVYAPLPIGFGRDGRSIVVELEDEAGDWVWRELSPVDGTWSEPLLRFPRAVAPIVDRLTNRVVGSSEGATGRVQFADREVQFRWNSLVRALGRARVRYIGASDDFGRLVVLVFERDAAPEFRLLDWSTRRAVVIGPVRKDIHTVAEIREIQYSAGDGFRVPAVLTLPPGREARRLPLVVMPGSWPTAIATPDFCWWAQALASRGYAVLQPNARGSALSPAHRAAGFGEWSRRMQTDVSDGVAHLVAEGVADPQRVCVVGYAYGGYVALSAAARQSGVYRCAVSVAGFADPRSFLQWTARMDADGRWVRGLERFLGAGGAADAFSPLAAAASIEVPVMLVHGRDDVIVPFEQSASMAAALRGRRRSVELVELRDEDHWLSRSETRVRMLEATTAFLRTHNPP